MENKYDRERRLLSAEREDFILTALGDGVRTISELAGGLGVSEATIRRDLQSMEQHGQLRRVHGGAVKVADAFHEPLFHEKASQRAELKEKIAERALEFIEDDDSIYLDGGSTVLALARRLNRRKRLTIVTNSLMAAAELIDSPHKLILLGGEFRPISRTMVGPLTAPIAEALHIGKAFLGTIGLSAGGMTTTDPGEAFTKQLILRGARHAILLADSVKFGVDSLVNAGPLDALDAIVTDSGVPEDFNRLLRKLKIELIKVNP